MASCDEKMDVLVRAADGLATDVEWLELERHLTACAGCRDALAVQQEIRARLRSREAAPVPPGFGARVAGRLDGSVGWLDRFDWRASTLRWAPVAAIGLLLLRLVSGAASAPDASSSPDGAGSDGTVVAALLWQNGASGDTLLYAALSASPDDIVEPLSEESRD